MLEGLVAGLLNRFLGMYVKNFDPGQLRVGIWSGDVTLHDLELRREALDQLKLPINVAEGHLGKLTLSIPWSNLRGAPVKVYVEDVFLLASPKDEAVYDEDDEERRRQRLKMEKLDSAELLKERSQEGLSEAEQMRSQSFTESLVTKIVDNLQVTVKNIHVRYEDAISAPNHPFALGLTLAEFSAVSTDGEWKPAFIQDSARTTHKLATLGALSIYWDTDSELLGYGREIQSPGIEITPHDEMLRRFKQMIGNRDSATSDHQFILKPVSGQAKIELDKSGDPHAPKLRSTLLFDEIGLVLDDHQYRDALMMVDLFHYFIRHQEYKKYEPQGVTVREDPRAWLKFAGNAVLSKIQERNRKWTWAYFRERRDDRIRYIELFKKRKQTQQLDTEETEDLSKLEWKLEYHDLRFWRSLARNQLKKENAAALKKAQEQSLAYEQQQQQQGWLSWAWGSKPEEPVAKESENTQMTEQQRKELYDAIDWDEKTALSEVVDVPRDTVKLQLNAFLRTGSFTLRQSPHGKATDLLSLHFDMFKATVMKRPDSFLSDISLGGLRVNDGTTPHSMFTEIVRVKDAPVVDDEKPISMDELEKSTEKPFFNFVIEQNPLDGQGDFALVARLKPLEIVWNPNFVVGIVKFFRPPERHMESISALMETAGATVEGLRQQTRAGLEFALEEHKTINAKLDLQAPLIIVPQSITSKRSTCIILDAGHISVSSQLVDRATMKEVQSKEKQPFTAEHLERLRSLMYDKFLVKLTSTQLLIGPSIDETKAQITKKDDEMKMRVVEKINVDFVVEISILPKAPSLTRLRVSGHMPVLHATASDTKYKTLMRIIDVAIPNFDDEPQRPPLSGRKASRPRLMSNVSSRSRKTHHRSQSQTTQLFLTQQTSIILDDDTDDGDNFEDAQDGTVNEQLKMQQRSFEFNFSVDKLQGSLYKSDPDRRRPDKLLVELVAQHFDLEFYIRPYDMVAEVSLGSVTVDDFVDNPPAEFKSIVSSGDADDEKEDRNLVQVKFVRVKKESPEFMPVYKGIETNIDVAVSTINLIVTRKTLLTLLDFILVTFANNETSSPQQRGTLQESDSDDDLVEVPAMGQQQQQQNAGSIKVKVDLKSIRMILNNDGIRLATLSFMHADVGIFLRGQTMRVGVKLGDLSLVDDVNLGVSDESNLRKLVTIHGDELADFRYETFDSTNKSAYPGYDSSIFLRAGSVKVNFMEEPFRKIVDFLIKFGKMQAIYNAARQAAANQANQLQQGNNRIKFDVVVKTPIVVFPRVMMPGQPGRDLMTAYLGEIYALNKFVPLGDSEDAEMGMKITAGIRNIQLKSLFHYPEDVSEELELIDHVDLGFNVTYAEHKDGHVRPELEIEGTMSQVSLKITQYQLQFLLELSRAVPAVFAGDAAARDEEAARDVDEGTLQRARTMASMGSSASEDQLVDLGPELGRGDGTWTRLDLLFKVPEIALELIHADQGKPVQNVDHASLSRFSLDESRLKTKMVADGSLEAEFVIHSFTIYDSRSRETNRFKRIMTSRNKEVQQFMASISMSAGKARNLVAIVAIDSPRVIFALDYLFAIQAFISAGLQLHAPAIEVPLPSTSPNESDAESMQITLESLASASQKSPTAQHSTKSAQAKAAETGMLDVSFRVNVVDAQVILIANPLSSSSEAIVLGTRQVLLSQQNALTFQVSEVGMFLCRMDKFEDSRLRIIDDFSILVSMDNSMPNRTTLHVDLQPLILRLSLRDILLAMQIFAKATELSGIDKEAKKKPSAAATRSKHLRRAGLEERTSSGKVLPTLGKPRSDVGRATSSAYQDGQQGTPDPVSQRTEELTATIEGIRVVLIGDLHELPILDLNIKDLTLRADNWSSNLQAETSIEMYTNVYNFSKSAWEPLLEPWQVGFGISRDGITGQLGVEVVSKKEFDITVTTSTIALASKSFDFLTREQDVLGKPRGVEAPYHIRNHTGFDVTIQAHNTQTGEDIKVHLVDGDEAPWSFEAWEKMRENLSSESQSSTVTVTLEGSGFGTVKNVRLNREGEFLYGLRPKTDNVLHRILVDVRLGADNVKYVVLRSPLLVENQTQIPIELGVYDPKEGHLLKIEKIPPGESRPAPVGAVYLKSLLVKPDSGFGYSWSTNALWWRDMLKEPTRTLACKGEHGNPFYFQMSANFDRANPLVKIYPYMRIKLSAPIVLENLLPFDFKYRIYDKNTKRDWTNFLRKGGVSPVHVTELSHLLLLSIDMQDTVFKSSEFAIINTGNADDFKKEDKLVCRDDKGLNLNLKLHYFRVLDSGGAFKVTVYSPYVILNKTGLDFAVKARGFLKSSQPVAGQAPLLDLSDDNGSSRPKAVPLMFSFLNDDHRNRAFIKIGDSEWSKPQTFDAIGSTSEVVLASESRNAEIHVGVSIESGEGKYKLSRVVKLAPRFIIQNKTGEEINVREPSSSSVLSLRPGSLQPLHFLKRGGVKQLCLCYPGINYQWTSPFNISDVGTIHIKISRPGQRQRLIRVEILIEESTIFLDLSMETSNWPFSMRNESDTEFTFYQANPNVEEDGAEEDRSGWRLIKYRLPPRSIMPYAWDFPAAKFREVVISAYGKDRHVKLAEIGNQVPMKFLLQGNQQKIVDINVAADGPTQSLILSNFKQSRSVYRQKPVAGHSTSSSNSGFEVKRVETGVMFKATLKLAGIGVSLINSQLRELAYVTCRGVELAYTESAQFQTVSLAIKWIQIDNQLYGGLFPMILYPSVVPKRDAEVDAHPSLHCQVTRVKDNSYGVFYIKYATILLQEMTVELDEDFVYALLDFSKIPGASWADSEVDRLCDETLDIPQPKRQQAGQDIYFEVLNIQPMQVNLSFMRTERVNVEDKTSSRNPLMFFVNVLTMAIGNVNDAPIQLNALLLDNVRVNIPILTQSISNHYSQEVLYQVHKILGSADFLGNPVGLFNNLSSGFTDIFYEPYQGLVMSDKPEDLGLGIAKGAASFVKKSVYGFTDSFSKFTGSLSKGLAAATLDKQFQDRRRITRARNRPKHALYGVTAGANSLFTSVASGVGGLARKPLEGAEQEGALGFFKGVGKGVLGLATKPAIGVLDLASNVSEGIRNTTTVFDGSELDRVRIPRFIPSDGIVRPYNQREALGQMWLKGVDGGRYFDESYIAHLQLPREDMVVMVTYAHILLVRSKRLTTEWDVPLKDVQRIARERTGLSLTLRGGQNGPFIPIAEESSRGFLYRMVGVGVEEFNRRSRGE